MDLLEISRRLTVNLDRLSTIRSCREPGGDRLLTLTLGHDEITLTAEESAAFLAFLRASTEVRRCPPGSAPSVAGSQAVADDSEVAPGPLPDCPDA